jgi:CheY-like chemotaxis protein
MAQQPDSSLTVLVVDDDDDVRSIATVIVAELGFRVLDAASGAAALDILRGGERVDVLLTDVAMPKMGGSELAFLAKELRPNLMVVYSSAYVHLSENDPALRYGPLIEKPWTRDRLGKVLEALLASHGADTAAAHPSSPTGIKLPPDASSC